MRTMVKAGWLSVSAALVCFGAIASGAERPHAASQEEKQIADLEARRGMAIAGADFDLLASLLADDYMHVLGNGSVLDKAGYVASVKQIPRVPIRGPLTIRVYGDLAIITGDFINHMKVPGEPERTTNAYATQIVRKINMQWKFESFQVSLKVLAPPSGATAPVRDSGR